MPLGNFHRRSNTNFRWKVVPAYGYKEMCKEYYDNRKALTLIGSISIHGYIDGVFHIHINPVNRLTKLTELPVGFNNGATYNTITVSNIGELRQALSAISKIDELGIEVKHQIEENFFWFQTTSMKPEVLFVSSLSASYFECPTLNDLEKELVEAVERKDIKRIEELLALGISPDLPIESKYGIENTILFYCLWKYIRFIEERPIYLKIVDLLLLYGADYKVKDLYLKNSALTIAAECDCQKLVDLILKHVETVEFKPNVEEPTNVVGTVNEHIDRLDRCKKRKITKSDICRVDLSETLSGNILTSFIRDNGEVITAEQKKTTELNLYERERLFELYDKEFSVKEITNKAEKKEYFKKKLSIHNADKNVYVDVVKNGADKIIGFNCFEVFHGEFNSKPYTLVYCSLACVERAYQGTRMMSLLSFRIPYALKKLNPNRQGYVFFDAISMSSFRQTSKLKQYPKYRDSESSEFVQHILRQIYGNERAGKFDGKNRFFLETASTVNVSIPEPKNYDEPGLIDYYLSLTEGKGGAPVFFPTTKDSEGYFNQILAVKLNGVDFREHIKKLIEYSAIKNLAAEDAGVAMGAGEEEDFSCLWKKDRPYLTTNMRP